MMYEFSNQSLIFGYEDEQLIGMFYIQAGENMSRDELLGLFENRADYLLTVPFDGASMGLPSEDATEEEIAQTMYVQVDNMSQGYDVLLRAKSGNIRDDECEYQIPKVLH